MKSPIIDAIQEDFDKCETIEEKWKMLGRWSMWLLRRIHLCPGLYRDEVKLINDLMDSIGQGNQPPNK